MAKRKRPQRESDPLNQRPENWYQGPLIFPAFPEEGVEKETPQSDRREAVGSLEEWSD